MFRDLKIQFEAENFPSGCGPRHGTLDTNWGEILWSALTIGRPSTFHVFRHGAASFHEAIFRLALVRMAIQQDWNGHLRRTDAFAAMDPTEKGMVSYFLGMTLCKLFASRHLRTPWLLHLDVFAEILDPVLGGPVELGRSRPDLVGKDYTGQWHAFESKGRSSAPSRTDKDKAKTQANRLVSVGGANCTLHVGSFAFFRSDILEYYWADPEPDEKKQLEAPEPGGEWSHYYKPSLAFALSDAEASTAERALADIEVSIHPDILALLNEEDWAGAQRLADQNRIELVEAGYQADGLKVVAGQSWEKPYEFREKGWR